MIPTILAAEVTEALRDFLITGFEPSNPVLAPVIRDFLDEPDNLDEPDKLAKGPYLSLGLPFEKAPGGEPFPKVPLGFEPYRHQRSAMERLGGGKSTVIATGTGSGKTECYLLPILGHCREQAGKQGIKAILIYPMNALALDQAKRIAQAIHGNDALRGRMTAGLYVGGRDPDATKAMTEEQVITDRRTLRDYPPDILLTNYKMLDYLMIRPGDQRLWRHNDPQTLRYLVVDELHSFDGAQGTDLACLLRRLRDRLGATGDQLVCAGTSATLGARDDEALLAYVSSIFDQEFGSDSIVGETRQSPQDFLGDALIQYYPPRPTTWGRRSTIGAIPPAKTTSGRCTARSFSPRPMRICTPPKGSCVSGAVYASTQRSATC